MSVLRDVVEDMGWLIISILIGDVQLQGHLGQHAGLIGGSIGVGPAAYLGLWGLALALEAQ